MASESYHREQGTTRYDGLDPTASNLQVLLDPTLILMRIRASIMGEQWDAGTERYVKVPHLLPLMNEHGVNDLMRELETLLSTSNALGHIKNKEFNDSLRECWDALLDFLLTYCYNYGIREGDLKRIRNQIVQNLKLFFSRARDGKTLEAVKAMYGHKEVSTVHDSNKTEEEKKQGFSLFPKLK